MFTIDAQSYIYVSYKDSLILHLHFGTHILHCYILCSITSNTLLSTP